MLVYLDMDGVVTDFMGGVFRHFKQENPYLQEENLGKWNVDQLLGLTPAEFYAPLEADFWLHLEWMTDGKEILALVEDTYGRDNICLFTSATRNKTCIQGKLEWIERHMHPHYRNTVMTGSKKFFAASRRHLLIDDSDSNIDKFRQAGGNTCLVPRPWNAYHARPTIPYLEYNFRILNVRLNEIYHSS